MATAACSECPGFTAYGGLRAIGKPRPGETVVVAAAVAAASGAASVRVWHITPRGWDPWTERPLPEVVRVANPPDAIHNHFLVSPSHVKKRQA